MHIDFWLCECKCVCVFVYELIIKKIYNKLINHNNRNHCILYACRRVLGRRGSFSYEKSIGN